MTVLAGSVTLGAANDFFGAGEPFASPYTVVAAGTPDQAQVFVRTGSTFTSLLVGIWAASGADPGALIGSFAAVTSNTNGTKTVGGYSGGALTLGATVWLGALSVGGTWNDTGTAGAGGYKGRTGAGLTSLPDPFGTTNASDGSADFLLPVLIEQVGGGDASTTTPPADATGAFPAPGLPIMDGPKLHVVRSPLIWR